MKESFDVLGMQFEGPILEGSEGLALYKKVALIVPDTGLYQASKDRELAAVVMRISIHPLGERVAKDTLKGWTCNGVAISEANWDELFSQKGKYMAPYTAAFSIWSKSGFLGE